MTKHHVSMVMPATLNPNRVVAHDTVPSPSFWRRISMGLDHVATHQHRCWLMLSDDMHGLSPGANPKRVAHFSGVTGPATRFIEVAVGLGNPDSSPGSAEPFVDVRIKKIDEATFSVVGSASYFGGVKAGIVPSDVNHAIVRIEVEPDTHYEGHLQAFAFSRPTYATVYEVSEANVADDTELGVVDPTATAAENDILAETIQDFIEAQNDLLMKAGAHLMSYARMDEVRRSRSASSYGPIETDWLQRINLDNHNIGDRDVMLTFGASAFQSPGGMNGVRLRNFTDGVTLAEITGFPAVSSAEGFLRTAFAVAPADVKDKDLRIELLGDGTNDIEIKGATLYEYEYDLNPAITHSVGFIAAGDGHASGFGSPNNGALHVRGDLTIEGWVRFATLPGAGAARTITGKWGSSGQFSYLFNIVNVSGSYRFRLFVNDEGTSGNSSNVASEWSAAAADTWVHVAATYRAQASGVTNQLKILINGDTQAATTSTDNSVSHINQSTVDFVIAQRGDGAEQFDGFMADLRIWREARSEADIQKYMSRRVPKLPQLVGHYYLDDTHNDHSLYKNHLTPSGAVGFSDSNLPY